MHVGLCGSVSGGAGKDSGLSVGCAGDGCHKRLKDVFIAWWLYVRLSWCDFISRGSRKKGWAFWEVLSWSDSVCEVVLAAVLDKNYRFQGMWLCCKVVLAGAGRSSAFCEAVLAGVVRRLPAMHVGLLWICPFLDWAFFAAVLAGSHVGFL